MAIRIISVLEALLLGIVVCFCILSRVEAQYSLPVSGTVNTETVIPENSTLGVVLMRDDLSTLLDSIQSADRGDLTEMLSDPDSVYTVFAPTNAAFNATGEELRAMFGDIPYPPPWWQVRYQIVPYASLSYDDLLSMDNEILQTSNPEHILTVDVLDDGETIMIHGAGGFYNSTILETVMAGETTIHIIDGVTLPFDPFHEERERVANPPPDSILGTLMDMGDFDERFVFAVKEHNLIQALSDPESEYTVFAAPDTAFRELEEIVNVEDPEEPPPTFIILFHIVPGRFTAADLDDMIGDDLDTLAHVFGGGDWPWEGAFTDAYHTMSVGSNAAGDIVLRGSFRGRGAVLTETDIEAGNSIIHKVSAALLP